MKGIELERAQSIRTECSAVEELLAALNNPICDIGFSLVCVAVSVELEKVLRPAIIAAAQQEHDRLKAELKSL